MKGTLGYFGLFLLVAFEEVGVQLLQLDELLVLILQPFLELHELIDVDLLPFSELLVDFSQLVQLFVPGSIVELVEVDAVGDRGGVPWLLGLEDGHVDPVFRLVGADWGLEVHLVRYYL